MSALIRPAPCTLVYEVELPAGAARPDPGPLPDGVEVVSHEERPDALLVCVPRGRDGGRGALAALGVAWALARETGGQVFDGQTTRAVPLSEVAPRELPPLRDRLQLVSAGDEAGDAWLTTLCMRWLGLPELQMLHVSESRIAAAGVAMKLLILQLDELLEATGDQPVQVQTLPLGTAEAGPPPLVELTHIEEEGQQILLVHPPGDPDGSLDPILDAMAATVGGEVGGALDATTAMIELQRAADVIRSERDAIRRRFRAGLGRGRALRVCLLTDGGPEWVTVASWSRRRVTGRNDAGRRISRRHRDLVDWEIVGPDGVTEQSAVRGVVVPTMERILAREVAPDSVSRWVDEVAASL